MAESSKPSKRPRGLLRSKRAKKAPGGADDGDDRSHKRRKQDDDGPDQPDDSMPVDPPTKTDVTLEDWEDLKELFEKALEAYEGKGILHECDRFLRHLPDPTILYYTPTSTTQTETDTTSPASDPPIAFATIYASTLYYLGKLLDKEGQAITVTGEPTAAGEYYDKTIQILKEAW
ncbi:hypothetical protein FRB99_004486, partial [Tulasnella sp. 403]